MKQLIRLTNLVGGTVARLAEGLKQSWTGSADNPFHEPLISRLGEVGRVVSACQESLSDQTDEYHPTPVAGRGLPALSSNQFEVQAVENSMHAASGSLFLRAWDCPAILQIGFIWAALALSPAANAEGVPFANARALAKNICSQCHLFTE